MTLHREYLLYVTEREKVYRKKQAGKPKPWTKDPILQTYSFCNNDRENDRVTIWLRENWRDPNTNDMDLWFAMAVARCAINWPPTMQELGYPVPWRRKDFVDCLHELAAAGEKVYGGAYMIGTQGNAGNKAEFLADKLLTPLWKARNDLRPRMGGSLGLFHSRLTKHYAVGSFTAGQIIADTKHHTQALLDAPDWHTWAASGPGSRRGLNRLHERELNAPWREDQWLAYLGDLRAWANNKHGLGLDAQNTQNTLCEFDKYMRVTLGEGRPKALYDGV